MPINRFAQHMLCAVFAIVISISTASGAARTFFKPSLDGDRLAACVGGGSICGKPVADRICSARGYMQALTFRIDRTPKSEQRIRTIDNDLIAHTASEPTFVFVKCFTEETADRR